MTFKQVTARVLYPLTTRLGKLTGSNAMALSGNADIEPPVSIYSLWATTNDENDISFQKYRNKKILLVNTASFCAYTPQYESLEELYRLNKDTLVVLGFPANNFNDEPGTDFDIGNFCRLTYGISFQLFQKSSVLQPGQNDVFAWLTDPALNGWNSQAPEWNFYKYLIDEKGRLTHVFGSAIDGGDAEIKKAVGQNA